MRKCRPIPAFALLLTLGARPLTAQWSRAAGVAAAQPIDAERVLPHPVFVADSVGRSIPIWPFALIGAVAGGALAIHHYNRAVAASGDGDFAASLTIPLTLGIGALVGGAGGAIVGEMVRVIAR